MAKQEVHTATGATFSTLLERHWGQGHFVCVGLDPTHERLPESVKQGQSLGDALYTFNCEIIDATHDLVCAYKPNSAFFEAYGDVGYRALIRMVQYIKDYYPTIPVILDAKRADIGSTNIGYVQAAFDVIGVDAITVHPYLGKEALEPFLNRIDKGIIVLVKTSNPGSAEFQNLLVGEAQEPLYQAIARNVAQQWNRHGNCAIVVGATYPAELKQVRAIVGDMPILIPGIGTQGGEVAAMVPVGKDSRGWGMIINASRSVLYASASSDFAQAARQVTQELTAEINRYRLL